jgi:hypothetical protein
MSKIPYEEMMERVKLAERYSEPLLMEIDVHKNRIKYLEAAIKEFKKSFDKGFPNSLNAIQARDKMFEVLTK